ncbi:MAG: peptidase M4 [Chloroflexi bacterium]|nr:peptidase M4 [Chloroflexota bacterium]
MHGPMMGPGTTGGPGMMGPGMMGSGTAGPGMMGPGIMGSGATGQGMMGGPWSGTATPLQSLPDAQTAFQAYVDRLGNPNLALDEVMEFAQNYYAVVKDRSTGSGAFELLANKQNGAVFLEFGPAMMWNTQYGHGASGHSGMMGAWTTPAGDPTVSGDRARELAQQWLDANLPGNQSEEPDAFPGYYTAHFGQGGQVTGMLSVNAYTGQVWYHTWHGAFVSEVEVGG